MNRIRFDRCRHVAQWPDDWWERIDRYAKSGNQRLLKYWTDNNSRPQSEGGRACPLCPSVKGLWQRYHQATP